MHFFPVVVDLLGAARLFQPLPDAALDFIFAFQAPPWGLKPETLKKKSRLCWVSFGTWGISKLTSTKTPEKRMLRGFFYSLANQGATIQQ